MVIIEGPDSAGKSTLIAHLQEHFGNLVELSATSRMSSAQRNDPRFRDPQEVHERVYQAITAPGAIAGQGRVILHDRLFFSELVYGHVLRGGSCFTAAEQTHITRLLTAISPPIIICLPPLEAIHAKIYGADQMEGATANIDKIYTLYEALLPLRRPAVIHYDYTKGPAAKDKVVRKVEAYMERRNKRAWSPTSTTSST